MSIDRLKAVQGRPVRPFPSGARSHRGLKITRRALKRVQRVLVVSDVDFEARDPAVEFSSLRAMCPSADRPELPEFLPGGVELTLRSVPLVLLAREDL